MKRYWLFQGDVFYPDGGMKDFIRDGNTLEEVREFDISEEADYIWGHIFDSEINKIIFYLVENEDNGTYFWEKYYDPS